MGQREGGAPSLPVIAGRARLCASGGPDATAICSTKANCSASTVCKALGALARPQSQENWLEGGWPCNNTGNECPGLYSDFAKAFAKIFLASF